MYFLFLLNQTPTFFFFFNFTLTGLDLILDFTFWEFPDRIRILTFLFSGYYRRRPYFIFLVFLLPGWPVFLYFTFFNCPDKRIFVI